MAYLRSYKLYLLLIILGVLFILPLRWFANDAFDACGDDHKMQFFEPESYINNFSIYTWSSYNALSVYTIPYPNLSFSYLPYGLKKIGCTPAQIEKIFYGFIICFGFLFTFLSIKELISCFSSKKTSSFWGSMLGAAFFTVSPIIQYSDWAARLSSTIFAVFLYPAMFYFLLLAINRKKIIYMLPGVILAGIFSFALYAPVPLATSFFIGFLIFFICYLILNSDFRSQALIFSAIYFLLIVVINMQAVLIVIDSILSNTIPILPTGSLGDSLNQKGAVFVSSIAGNFNCLYTFLFLPSKDFVSLGSVFKDFFHYLYSWLYLFLPIPFIIGTSLMLAERKAKRILLPVIISLLWLTFFITVGITDAGTFLFAMFIKKIPGFVMFRNFYGKFTIPFSFFYALAIGISVSIIFSRCSHIRKKIVVIVFSTICVLFSLPLFSGAMIGVSPSASIYEKLCPVIPQSHIKAVNNLKAIDDNQRVVIFPASFAQYMCFKGDNNQFYVAIPFIKILSGHDEFGGIWSYTNLTYDKLPTIVSNLMLDYDFINLYKILWVLNTGYLYSYSEIAPENAQMFIFQYPFVNNARRVLMEDLPTELVGDYEDVTLYEIEYSEEPASILAKSVIIQTDEPDWLSKLVYSGYLDPENRPQIVYTE